MKNKKLLAFKIKGIDEISDKLINFISENNVQSDSNETFQVFDHNSNIHLSRVNLIHGKNASGKSHFINIISMIDTLSSTSAIKQGYTFKYGFYNKINTPILIEAFYAIDKFIFKHTLDFQINFRTMDVNSGDGEFIHKMDIRKELVEFIEVEPTTPKSHVIDLFDKTDEWVKVATDLDISPFYSKGTGHRDFPVFGYVVGDYLSRYLIAYNGYAIPDEEIEEMKGKEIIAIQDNIKQLSSTVLASVGRFVNIVIPDGKLLPSIFVRILSDPVFDIYSFIRIFDKNIESITVEPTTGLYLLKYFNNKTIIRTHTLSGFVSTGTLRGMCMLAILSESIRRGEDIFIDEIEANLNLKIIKFFMDIINDPEVNKKNTRLIATTHYPEITDFTQRRDSIFISTKDNDKHQFTKLYKIKELEKYKTRMKDYSNSKLISKIFSLDIEPTFDDFILFKKGLKGD